MYKYVIFIVGLLPLCMYAERFYVDGIKVIIHTDSSSKILTDSEIKRKGLDGKESTVQAKIVDRLLEDRAKLFGINIQEAAEDSWQKGMKQNNMSEREMHELVMAFGYTPEEAKEELGRMFASNQIIGFQVQSQIFVSKRDVLAYYNVHPEYRQAEYFIARAVVPYSEVATQEELCTKLQTYKATGTGMRIAWSEPFWLLADEVAADKQFICSMEPGQISEPVRVYNGFELIKLIDKHSAMLVPLHERYNQIEYELKLPKFQQELERYTNELLCKATIIYV